MSEQNVINVERWKDIPDYEGIYQVSDMGRVRSLDRVVRNGHRLKGHEMRAYPNAGGYLRVSLCKNMRQKSYKVHRLVMLAFIGPSELQVDHGDSCRTNNQLSNLEYVTRRENINRGYLRRDTASKYPGVNWHKVERKWRSRIRYENKRYPLGTFTDELKAAEAYATARKEIKDGTFIPPSKLRKAE